jgi:norsolorinic acid ketoreductase
MRFFSSIRQRLHRTSREAMSVTTVLITGAKSGIGKGLLTAYAARRNYRVIAAIRDGTASSSAKELQSVNTGEGSSILVVAYDASNPNSAEQLTKGLETEHHIIALDVVIANAGILKHFGPAAEISAQTLTEHLEINSIAPILLYKATASLLNQSQQTPKFFITSSVIGSNGLQDTYNLPSLAYGISKAAANYAASRIHREEKRIVVVPVQPGWVQTDMGNAFAAYNGLDASQVPVKLNDSVQGLIELFDAATKEKHSGLFWDYEGKQVPW